MRVADSTALTWISCSELGGSRDTGKLIRYCASWYRGRATYVFRLILTVSSVSVGFVLKTFRAIGQSQSRLEGLLSGAWRTPSSKTASFIVPLEQDKRRQGISIVTSKHKQAGGLRIYDGKGKVEEAQRMRSKVSVGLREGRLTPMLQHLLHAPLGSKQTNIFLLPTRSTFLFVTFSLPSLQKGVTRATG